MDYRFSEQHIMLRESIRGFAAKEIRPIAEEIDAEDAWPEGMWEKLAGLGIMGITVDEEYGGAGADLLSAVIVLEELSKASPAIALSWGAHANLCCNNLNHNASPDQKRKYLPPLCTAKHIGALGLTEPNAGSDAVSIQTVAVRNGDHYVVNGTKMFITNGTVADTIVLYTKTDRAKGAKGITAFILDTAFPGFSVSKKLKKYGHRGSPTAELVLEDCRIPVENVLGEENRGIHVLMSGLDVERAFYAGESIGIAEACLELSLQYARERVQFGKPIGAFQLIQAKLADMYTQLEAGRALCYKAALLADQERKGGKGTEVHKLAAASILFNAEMAYRIADQAVQIHGGYGYMLEYPVQRFLRDAKLIEIGAGTSEIRRLIIARELLGV
ncbi:MAG: acyl-CoA dehydrogenase [Deltaproteobacteria bacterium HGW-Deltaproteobacteria-19]|jgi:isovaleryl-CoA dehydrogenase|nr:MAG: acyl-CoA dehydrogenase [Deltaproteobacteria bacterium HGW-Deltaproteobacteria-19]